MFTTFFFSSAQTEGAYSYFIFSNVRRDYTLIAFPFPFPPFCCTDDKVAIIVIFCYCTEF